MNQFGTSLSTNISNCDDIGQCWYFAILHCSISSQFDMWVDNDVPKWVPTLNNFYWSPFSKWQPQYHKNSTLSNINQFRTSFSTHISNFDDIGQCWILAVLWWPFWKWQIVEIVQCRESIRDIIIYPHNRLPFLKWPPQYHTNSTLSDIITIWYVGR
jgi:hypothetical protein